MNEITQKSEEERIRDRVEEIFLTDAHSWDDGSWIIPANSLDEAAKAIYKEIIEPLKKLLYETAIRCNITLPANEGDTVSKEEGKVLRLLEKLHRSDTERELRANGFITDNQLKTVQDRAWEHFKKENNL